MSVEIRVSHAWSEERPFELRIKLTIIFNLLNPNHKSHLIQHKMRPNEKEEINSRFDQIECLLRELKEESSKRYVEIDQKLNDVIESQKFLSKQYENFRNTIDNLINDNVKMREQLDKLRQQVGEAEKKVKTALDEVNNLEQYGRRDMIEIGGIPAHRMNLSKT